eukprot:21678-Heterocapsa_arctica.AAC.1
MEQLVDGAAGRGHAIWAVDVVAETGDPAPMTMCSRCGCFSQTGRNTQLLAPCSPPGRAGKYALSRVRSGLFPVASKAYQGLRVEGLFPIAGAAVRERGAA